MPRNSSGTYTLPTGNPVVSGTVIQSTWANSTLSDVANELTNSLARDGTGGMTGPFRTFDGSDTAPGLSFTNEPSSGVYRAGAGEWWGVVTSQRIFQVTTSGLMLNTSKLLQLPLGAVGAPSLTFSGDNDTGLWSPAANTLALSAGGAEKVRVTSSAVTITSATFNADAVAITGGTINGTPVGATSASTGAFTTLSATGAATLGNGSTVTGSGSNVSFYLSNTASGGKTFRFIMGATGDAVAGGIGLFDNVASTYRWAVSSAGDVGIGTTSPANYSGFTTLDIDSATNGGLLNIKKNGTTVGYINGSNAMLILGNNSEVRLNATGANPVTLWSNGSERVRVDSSGNMGVGTINPGGSSTDRQFTVQGTTAQISAFNGTFYTHAGVTATLGYISVTGANPLTLNTNGAERVRVHSSGGVSIGNTTDPGATNLSVTGKVVVGSNGLQFSDGSTQAASAIGYGQTWQNVLASRSSGTTYTNSTGRPIQVSVWSSFGSPQTLAAVVSSVSVATSFSGVSNTSQNCYVTFIVPPGATYSVTLTTSAGTSISGWAELR